MKTAAVIVAAGTGSRMGPGAMGLPKQMELLGDKALIEYSVERFVRLEAVQTICIVTREEWRGAMEELDTIRKSPKPIVWTGGGDRRQDSTMRGVAALPPEIEIVAVHDAARPFPPAAAIERAIAVAAEKGAAILTHAVTDTIKKVSVRGLIEQTLDRSVLHAAQTPQVFRRNLLKRAMKQADRLGRQVTDEASAVEGMGRPVEIITGSPLNIKVTHREDLMIAEAILRSGILEETER